jgi:hypothetical protein
MERKKFTNEIGNKIDIKVKKKNGKGIEYKTGILKAYKGVEIDIIGPTSMSSNEITIREAVELYNALGAFLKKHSML